jgi:predicted DNA-binding mobile mystery protein A
MKQPRSPELKRLRLRQAEERLAPWRAVRDLALPRGGWIRTVRHALGMGVNQLASRMGVKPPAVVQFEKGELAETTTLQTLRRAAEAMDCRLVYALVPNENLAATLKQQASEKARATRGRVSHTMALESQAVDKDEAARQDRELVQKLLSELPRTLWDDDHHHPDVQDRRSGD